MNKPVCTIIIIIITTHIIIIMLIYTLKYCLWLVKYIVEYF